MDTIYRRLWGGDNIHIGIYDRTGELAEASDAANMYLASKIRPEKGWTGVDLGSGYGGLCRFMADEYGCSMIGLNISKVENKVARRKNEQNDLGDLVEIQRGTFNEPYADENTLDFVCSQDALLHAPDKASVLEEAYRALKPGGVMVFSDLLLTDREVSDEDRQSIFDRVDLTDMGSFKKYRKALEEAGFTVKGVDDRTQDMHTHYVKARDALLDAREDLRKDLPEELIQKVLDGFNSWIYHSAEGNLEWGFFVAEKE
ncbi:MAG: SAM-dependent methyltransferase [Methanomassiliicoccales archaeon]